MHTFEKKNHWQWVLRDLKSIVMMQTQTVIMSQPLDLMKMISKEQLSDSRSRYGIRTLFPTEVRFGIN